MMNVHERQIKILEENLAHSLRESFNTVTPNDYFYVHTHAHIEERERKRMSAK